MACQQVSNIKNVMLRRISTGIPELDWVYGGENQNWGLPDGKISLWTGVAGIGKSRATIEIAKTLTKKMGKRVVYFQGETDLSSFKHWISQDGQGLSDNFFASDSSTLNEQIRDIKLLFPNVVIVDSVNSIEEFGSGVKKNIKEIYKSYKEAIKYVQTYGNRPIHIIFLCQLNKDGSTKGSSDLGHLVDTLMHITPWTDPAMIGAMEGYFCIKMGNKHRYGRTGEQFCTYWQHLDKKAYCASKERYKDQKWVNCFGPDPEAYRPKKKLSFWKKIF